MNCMKCGRETQNDMVFCQNCLLDMEKYPIQPGTVVQLPRRREASVIKKASKRHLPTPEEQILFLRKCIMVMTVLLALCIAAIALMFKPTMHYVRDEHVEIGQNYSSVVASATPSTLPSAE